MLRLSILQISTSPAKGRGGGQEAQPGGRRARAAQALLPNSYNQIPKSALGSFLGAGLGPLMFGPASRRETRDLMRFYQHIMTTELAEIRCRDVWYIVMAWHFYVHTSVSSESLAEAVGSYLAVTRRHNINGKLSMKHLVWSSKLRAFGLNGFGGEDGIMAYALNTHFQCSGPEGWRFCRETCNAKRHDRCSNEQRCPIVE